MLPFRKKKGQSEAMELTEDDLVLVDDPFEDPPTSRAPAALSPHSPLRAAPVAARARKQTSPAGSRRILDEHVEEDVAGQCLASIAAQTARKLEPLEVLVASSSHVRVAAVRPTSHTAPPPLPGRAVEPAFVAEPATASQRLPAVSPPPFVRTTVVGRSALRRETPPEAPGMRDSSPSPAFVRRSAPVLASAAAATAAPSVAPVSMPAAQSAPAKPNEPTVIVLRERPKAGWILAAAALGALGALAVVRLSAAPEARDVRPAAVAATPTATALPVLGPPSEVVLPAATAAAAAAANAAPSSGVGVPAQAAATVAAPAPSSSAAIVHFDDAQGVAIQSPRRPAAAAPAAPPVAAATPPSHAAATARALRPLGAALPDGSFSLGKSDTPSSASAPVAAPAPAPPKRALTPEQELAAAQLKASMK